MTLRTLFLIRLGAWSALIGQLFTGVLALALTDGLTLGQLGAIALVVAGVRLIEHVWALASTPGDSRH